MPSLGLLRHGIAEPDGGDPPLTEEGIQMIRAEAAGMARIGLSLDVIACSPVRRAHETALLMAEILTPGSEPEVIQALAPGCRLGGLLAQLGRRQTARSILLVGHHPDMGSCAAELIGARAPFQLDRGDLCWFSLDRWPSPSIPDDWPAARLQLMLPANLLAALG